MAVEGTLSSASRITYEYMLGGGSPPIVELGQQVDTTGYRAGWPVAVDASGHAYGVSTATLTSATGVFGVAIENSATTHTTDGDVSIKVVLATPMTVFSAVVAHATTASATVQASQIGQVYALTCSGTVSAASSETMIMDVATTASAGGWVIDNKSTTGTSYGRNYFIFSGVYATNSAYGYGTS
ncbi:MAG: hypothetical protein GWN93_22535 [Deltaproteobacteria bacterium]|nr:hypothetical protein [Deltaproteobacteria bacterium]